jgi:hypothetical protein
MRRVLASLLVFLMTFALVVRGVAAPLMHLHPESPAPTLHAAASQEHQYADCHDTEGSVGDSASLPHGHDRGDQQKDRSTHGKACDANGACCGYLVIPDAFAVPSGIVAVPEQSLRVIGAGIKPTNPDRPPSPPLA